VFSGGVVRRGARKTKGPKTNHLRKKRIEVRLGAGGGGGGGACHGRGGGGGVVDGGGVEE